MGKALIIGGSGAYLLEKETFGKVLGVKRLSTPYGLSNPIYTISLDGKEEFFFLSRHGEKDYDKTASFVNYRANIYAAKELGVSWIVSWTGPGSLKEEFAPGDYVLPDDVLDFTYARKKSFFENGGLGFTRQSPLFCQELQGAIEETLRELGFKYHSGGVYACTEGPRLETRAEIEALKRLGADMVGMTLSPEVFLARELEICYASICYITNYAEGIKELPFQSGILFEGMLPKEEKRKVDRAVESFPEIVKKLIPKIYSLKRECSCKSLMERYRKKGKIGNDWKEWLFRF